MELKKKTCLIFTLILCFIIITGASVYAEDESARQIYYFDKHYKIDKNKGFSLNKKETIKEKDNHYGWRLGRLYVSGFTQRTEDDNGNVVFLKNSGDQVLLGFDLEQNIEKLNGDDNLSITYDKKGYDEYFEVSETAFGKGTLIVRRTDYQNSKGTPQVYTNYLSAESKVNADTTVQVNEEGDYEVALDYTIKNAPRKIFGKNILPKTSDYTIRLFKFSVRNGNSMIFPFDVATGEELTNQAFTENGFKIDLAKSRYLKVFVKKETMDDLESNDTRENKPAKDGAEYTDKGIYTITVEDPSTSQITTKKIYVGTEDRYKAYVTTGLSLDEIDAQLSNGAVVAEDGNLIPASLEEDNSISSSGFDKNASSFSAVSVVIIVVIVLLLILVIVRRIINRTKNMKGEDQ